MGKDSKAAVGGEQETLLREATSSSSSSSALSLPPSPLVPIFVTKHGYSTSPQGLAAIVAEQQLGALQAFGGVQGLATAILASSSAAAAASGISTTKTLNLKDGLPSSSSSRNNDDDDDDESSVIILALQRTYGSNALPLPVAPNLLALMFGALSDPTMCMLLASAAVSLLLGLGVERDWEKGWIEGTSIAVTVCLVVSVAAGTDYSKAREFRLQQMQLESTKQVHLVRQRQDFSTSTNTSSSDADGQDDELKSTTSATTTSATIQYHPSEIVVGDVVRLAVGDICPADGVLFQASHDLKLDESALTGETELVSKCIWTAKNADEKNNSKTKEDNVVVDPFIVSGTNVMQGSGLFLVLAVGSNSIQGKILARIREQQGQDDDKDGDDDANAENGGGCFAAIQAFFTFGGSGDIAGATLMEKLDSLAVDIGKMGIIVALLVFIVMLTQWIYKEFVIDETCSTLLDERTCLAAAESCHVASMSPSLALSSGKDAFQCSRHFHAVHDMKTILEYFITAITILVVAVPEGLPLAVTLALAVSMRRMMRDANQVKHMDSTETMGSATTICSDKTGTLTENKMTAMKISYANQLYEHVVGISNHNTKSSSGHHQASLGSILKDRLGVSAKTRLLAEAILLNTSPTSRVTFNKDTGEYVYQGNPTECALVKLTAQLGFEALQMHQDPC
jgi:P-type Ca2+ transporter type 2B